MNIQDDQLKTYLRDTLSEISLKINNSTKTEMVDRIKSIQNERNLRNQLFSFLDIAKERIISYCSINDKDLRSLYENSQQVLEKERHKSYNLSLSLLEYEKNAALLQEKIRKLLNRVTQTKEYYITEIKKYTSINIELKKQIEIKDQTIYDMQSKYGSQASPTKLNELQNKLIDLKKQIEIRDKTIYELNAKIISNTSSNSKVTELQNIIIELKKQNTDLSTQLGVLLSNTKERELNQTIETLQAKLSESTAKEQEAMNNANIQKDLFNKSQSENVELKTTLSKVNQQLIESIEQNKKLNRLLDISKQKEESFTIQNNTAVQNANKSTLIAKELANKLAEETEKYSQLQQKYEELTKKSGLSEIDQRKYESIIANLREENDKLSSKNRELNNVIFSYNMDQKYKITPKSCKCCCDTDDASREHREFVRIEGELIRIKSENSRYIKEIENLTGNSFDLKKYGFMLADAVGSSFNPENVNEEIRRLIEIARDHHQKVNDTARVPLDPFDI